MARVMKNFAAFFDRRVFELASDAVQEEEWSKDTISDEAAAKLGGRTPLHILCARRDHPDVRYILCIPRRQSLLKKFVYIIVSFIIF